jgi:DNA repair exonuclease SbcCD ATPase subunit
MIQLKGWGVSDFATFSDTAINLSNSHGLYVVTGENFDSSVRDNTNAVGKTRLFSPIATTIYENDPMSLVKKNKKELLKTATSSTFLDIATHSGKVVRIKQTASKIFIYDANAKGDFEDTKAIKLEVARSRIAQMFPIRENMFYATCYIQMQRDCSFQRAKPKERLDFITELFDLHVYDLLRKEYSAHLRTLANAKTEHGVLANELVEAETKLKELAFTAKDKSKLRKLTKSLIKVSDRLQELYASQADLSSIVGKADRLEQLQSKLDAALGQIGDLSANEKTLDKLKRKLKDIRLWEKYTAALDSYKKQKAKIVARLEELGSIASPAHELKSVEKEHDSLSDEFDSLKSKRSALQSALRDYENQLAKFTKLKDRVQKLRDKALGTGLAKTVGLKKSHGYKEINSTIRPVTDLARVTVDLCDRLDGHDTDGVCPVCNSGSFNSKSLKRNLANARSLIADREVIEEYAFALRDFSNAEEPEQPDGNISKLDKRISKIKSKMESLEERHSVLSKYIDLEESLQSLDKPKKPCDKPTLGYDECESMIENIQSVLEIKSRISDLGNVDGVGDAKKRLKKIKSEIANLVEETKTLDNKIRKLKLREYETDILNSNIAKLSKKLEAIGPLLAEQDLYKALQEAYNPNNLKLQAADRIVGFLEDSLNAFSHLAFLEPMRFEIRTQKDGIRAEVIRSNGERSDIVHLSGAETNCFRLLFAMSLLPLLPENRRTNFLVLDEPDSNCSDPVRDHLIREFLPKLRTVVPHIFWITPKTIDGFDDCTFIKIEKRSGVSNVSIISNEE